MGMCRRWLCLACLAKYLSFFVLVQMSLEPCLIKHSGRWIGPGTVFFLSLPANVFLAQHQHGFSQATVLSYSVLLKPNLARALSCLLLLQCRLQCNANRPIRYSTPRHLIIKSDAFESSAVGVIGVAGKNGWP